MIGRERLAKNLRLITARLNGNKVALMAGAYLSRTSLLEPPVRMEAGSVADDSRIGRYSYLGANATVVGAEVGRFCSIAHGATVGATGHPTDRATTHTFPYIPADGGFVDRHQLRIARVRLGHDVWIGCDAVVLSGVTIGDGAVIAANSVVTKDVPPFAVAVGAPATVRRFRFDADLVERLAAVAWWNWPKDLLARHVDLFRLPLDESVMEKLEDAGHQAASSAPRP